MAGYRLVKGQFPFTIGFLDSTFTSTVAVITGKYTIFVVNDGGDDITFAVDIGYALFVDNCLGFG